MSRVYIGVGSNTDAKKNIQAGIALLQEHFAEVRLSPLYESDALANDSARYLNGAISLKTDLPPAAIKQILYEIENQVGRDRAQALQVALDLDLLLYDDSEASYQFQGQSYSLPHDALLKYSFVAVPLADIAPDVVHPETGETIQEIANSMDSSHLSCIED